MHTFRLEMGWLMCLFCLYQPLVTKVCGGKSDRIHLIDVQVLTLHHGRYTEGRRSRPVPQMKCLGGTAGCSAFVPSVVQCYNRGSDGTNVQWECKTDMDNTYRFGEIAVTCEGYDHANDPYVLKGSCGLEYYLDLTKEGYEQSQWHGGGHRYYGNSNDRSESSKVSVAYLLAALAILVVIIVFIYRWILAPSAIHFNSPPPYSSLGTDNAQPPPYSAPPPPGFRPEFMPNNPGAANYGSWNPPHTSSYPTYDSPMRPKTGSTDGGPGFWSGAMTGGLLGYLFGSRSSGPSTRHQPANSWGIPHSQPTSAWGSSLPGSSSSSGASHSTGTRTASGFGGTRHR